MRKSPNYWNYDTIKEVALLCKSKTEFRNKYKGAYKSALKKWLVR